MLNEGRQEWTHAIGAMMDMSLAANRLLLALKLRGASRVLQMAVQSIHQTIHPTVERQQCLAS